MGINTTVLMLRFANLCQYFPHKKMKKIKVILLILFIYQNIVSQNEGIQLVKEIDTILDKKLKLNRLNKLITTNYPIKNYTKYVENFIDIAIELKQYKKAILVVLSTFNNINYYENQPNKALDLLSKVEKYKHKVTDSSIIAELYKKKAEAFYSIDSFKEAIENYTKAINKFGNNKKDSINKTDAILYRGQTYSKLGKYLASIKDYELAIKYYKKLNDTKYTYFVSTALTKIYAQMGLYEKAIEEIVLIIADKRKNNYTYGLTSNYYNLAINYKEVGNHKKYRNYLFKALKAKKKENDKDGFLPYYQVSIAKYFLEKDSLQEAKKYLILAKKEYNSMLKNSYSLNFYNKIQCSFLFKSGKYSQSLSLAKKTIIKFKKNGDLNSSKELSKLIYLIYLTQNDHKNALNHLQNYIKTKDSISKTNKISSLEYYQTLLNAEKKEKQIIAQKQSILLLARKNKNLVTNGVLGCAFLFIFFYLYKNRLHLKKKKNCKKFTPTSYFNYKKWKEKEFLKIYMMV